jgi:hypothetical protein
MTHVSNYNCYSVSHLLLALSDITFDMNLEICTVKPVMRDHSFCQKVSQDRGFLIVGLYKMTSFQGPVSELFKDK